METILKMQEKDRFRKKYGKRQAILAFFAEIEGIPSSAHFGP